MCVVNEYEDSCTSGKGTLTEEKPTAGISHCKGLGFDHTTDGVIVEASLREDGSVTFFKK